MATKTYILAPNLTTHPGDALAIGTIVAEPFRPLKPLSECKETLETVTHTEFEAALSDSSRRGFSSGVWAQFLEVANAKLSAKVGRDVRATYAMAYLETITLRQHPGIEYAAARAQEPAVRAAMESGLLGRQPVCMITGVKIAKGLQWSQEQIRSLSGEVGASIPITPEVSAGIEIGAERASEHHYSSRTEQDIVFAYQLHLIATKGWWKPKLSVDQYVPKGGLLGKKDHGESDDVDVLPATSDDLTVVAEDNEDELHSTEVLEAGESCLCFQIKDE
ncbi:uncharacterized protein RHO25_012929 [Cercospora beticola]|uniref:Uncharacterized protein n=2 Tax=Cercospora beticola TaxID=122368 RepID=A0ABZ0P8R4_CERBT|nr:hypothetical protein RHO25_012929 [Cercospora beticola]